MVLYKVVGCPKCKKLQVTTGEVAFKCKYCDKATKLASLVVFFASESDRDARERLYRLQGHRDGH